MGTYDHSHSSVVAGDQHREFSAAEHQRIQVMIAEGEGQRSFSSLIVDIDKSDFETTLSVLETRLRALLFQNK
ncbi:hypothetical protein J5069_06015 [Candidatus Symbiopectobacterium sp. NZEC127]|uniref:hypothetical protein n=1 Tax=Candidatus Symbiopectobacterium sp. NZEC127 TaxID=2820472 RepID=UPI002225BFAA|nr:hypothetical protein [Candidatus Symbiopectobacterium sp. NZEC127]MCW2485451.1 hypothetical protein [Candidatus Symbiopectobacterium sp. NZEC127]